MSEINSATLKVSKLEATEDHFDLYELFKEFGNIFSCKVSKKYSKGENNVILSESNKYGYVTYETEDEAKAAYEHYKSNQVIKVELFKEDASISGQTNNLFVKNFPTHFIESDLEKEFSKFGKVTSTYIKLDKAGRSCCNGFVCFETPKEAKAALDGLNGTMVGDMKIYVGFQIKKDS